MKHIYTSLGLCGAALITLSACATNGTSRSEDIAELLTDSRVGEAVDNICFTRGIDGFSDNDDYSVVLRRGVKDEYLVVTKFCPDLQFAQSIGLDNRRSCLRRQDDIHVFRTAFPQSDIDRRGFTSCYIDAIYKWDKDALDPSEDGDGEISDDSETSQD